MTWLTCYKCKCQMWIPDELNTVARCNRGSNGVLFYCAYGHAQFFVEGETTEDKLRRERDRLNQRLAEKDDEIRRQRSMRETAERQTSAARGQVTKIKNRVGRGVCPCCNRTFDNLARHMGSQHPTFVAEEVG